MEMVADELGYVVGVDTHLDEHVLRRVWAIEGAGHYGAALARFLAGRGETVLESGRTTRAERRVQGKDDWRDALRSARTAPGSEATALSRSGQRRESLRLLLIARRSAVDVRREALVQLRAVIVQRRLVRAAPPPPRRCVRSAELSGRQRR